MWEIIGCNQLHCLLRFLRRKVCKIDLCVLLKCINSIFFLHSLTHSCKFKFPQILFGWASVMPMLRFCKWDCSTPLILKRMTILFLCYLFNYYYTWLCSNTAVFATAYFVVPENIYTPHPRRALLLKNPIPWNFHSSRYLSYSPPPVISVIIQLDWVPHGKTLQLHADLSVYPKFWGYQVFI